MAAEHFVRQVITAIRAEGTCWVGGTRWRGHPMLRLPIANRSTTPEDVSRSATAILGAVHQVRDDPVEPRRLLGELVADASTARILATSSGTLTGLTT